MRHPVATAHHLPGSPHGSSDTLPSADEVVAHTLLNCLVREVSAPEHQTAVVDGSLLLRLPRLGALLKVAVRRTSLLGSHRFTGPVRIQTADGGWEEVAWDRLAALVEGELSLRTGERNEEFLEQVRSSHHGVSLALESHRSEASSAYLRSEQSLLFGHRFHPTPKARGGDRHSWAAFAPEFGASFPLRHLAVRQHLVAEATAVPDGTAALDRLRPQGVEAGYTFLPRTRGSGSCCEIDPECGKPCSAATWWTWVRASDPSHRRRRSAPSSTGRASSSSAWTCASPTASARTPLSSSSTVPWR